MLQGIKIAGGRSALGADFGIFVKKVLSRGAADLDGENKTVMYNIIEAWHWKGLKIFFLNVCLQKMSAQWLHGEFSVVNVHVGSFSSNLILQVLSL